MQSCCTGRERSKHTEHDRRKHKLAGNVIPNGTDPFQNGTSSFTTDRPAANTCTCIANTEHMSESKSDNVNHRTLAVKLVMVLKSAASDFHIG